MKDIGSLYPIYDKDLAECKTDFHESGTIEFSLCREALYAIAKSLENSNKRILIPAYTCSTVYLPFKYLGWEIEFYSIDLNLTLNIKRLSELIESFNPDAIIFHPYYGQGFSNEEKELIKRLHNRNIKIIIDLTQSIFLEERLEEVDYYVASYRKWFPIPDGSFLETKYIGEVDKPSIENTHFVTLQKGAMYLRGLYFITEDEEIKIKSIELNKRANLVGTDYGSIHKMSSLSSSLLSRVDKEFCKKARIENFQYLANNLDPDKVGIIIPDSRMLQSAPLYFPIYVEKRSELQAFLAQFHVYLPILWPIEDEKVLINDTTRYIYDHIICVVIDQRYDLNDMHKIATLINEFYD